MATGIQASAPGLRVKVRRALGPQARWLGWRVLPVLVLLTSLGLTTAFWLRERDEERRTQHAAFDVALNDASQQMLLRMTAQEHLLQGVQGLLAATPLLEAAALQRYVGALPLGADFAGLQGIALARRGGTPGHPKVLLQQIEPAAASNVGAVGSDLWDQPLLRQALSQAEDSGRMALSAKLNLRQLQLGVQAGFVMVLPVYGPVPQSDQPPATVAGRRAALQAWVVAPLVAPDLMASLYGSLPRGLALTVYDGQQLDDAAVLYRSANSSQVTALAPQQQAREYLVIGGHTWTLTLQASADFAARGGVEMPGVVLAAGGSFSLMLALLAGLLGTARERAQALAERMTQALRESERRWSFALESAGDGVWDMQPETGAINSSARWKTLMGWLPGRHEPALTQWLSRIHPEDRSRAQVELQRCLDGFSGNLISEYRVAAASNLEANPDHHAGWNWVFARGTVVERDSRQRPLRMIGTLSDINARRHSEERLRFMALHDPLTELANRAHFDERLHFALANARRYNESLGLILLDLDRFKPINDQFGHAVGDQLLQLVARRIKGAVRETDTVGRIGGDEFVVLLTGPVSRETAQLVVDKIFNQVALPMALSLPHSGTQIKITCSLGLAIYPNDGADELSLTKAADDAMYANKRSGRHVMGNLTSS